MHPFRFGALIGRAASRADWVDQLRTAESVGCSTVLVSDHLHDKLAPVPAVASAAELTGLCVGTFVLANDLRNPAVLAKEAATLELLAPGRIELGIGAGWSKDDFDRSGIPRARGGVRVDRLIESLDIMDSVWRGEPVEHHGHHYRLSWTEQLPPPARPRLLIGGGGPRMLRLAGERADIVGISLDLRAGTSATLERGIARVTVEMLDEKVEWVREGAGTRFPGLELNVLVFAVRITPDRAAAAAELAGDAEAGLATPHYLVGTVDEICDELEERRERFGISYVVVGQQDLTSMEPVIARLADR